MKKLFILIAALFPALSMMAENPPIFESSLLTEQEFAKWNVVDNNADEKTWQYNPEKEAAHYPYAYNIADDWLISPAIKIEKAGAYMLQYEYMGSSYGEMMDVFFGSEAKVSALTNLVMDLGIMDDGDNYRTARQLISVDKAQDIYFGFHAKSDPDKFKILLRNVKLMPADGNDVAIDAIKTIESGYEMGLEDITITIANYGIKAISNIDVTYQINNNDIITETVTTEIAPGAKFDYTFTQKADFTATGNYEIKANVVIEGDEIPENNERVISLRHKGPQSVPYFNGFENSDGIEDIVIFDVNEDPDDNQNGKWSRHENSFFAVFSRTGDYSMVYWYSKNNPGDDWFILEPIVMEEGYYAVKFWYSCDHDESVSLHYGNEAKPEAMTNMIVKYENINEPQYKESANIVHISKAGVYFFGFKAESTPNQNIICIDDFSITKIENVDNDLEVSPLKLSANGYVRNEMRKDIAFSVSNKGILSIDNVRILATIDDKIIFDETSNMSGEATRQIKISNGFGNLDEGMHQLMVSVTSDTEENNKDNNYLVYDFKMLGDAVIMYDFEEGKVPDDFILTVADDGIINNGLKDVFPNNEAWAPIEINENEYYGKWMLASGSWLNNCTTGADRWCILPKVYVGAEGGEIVWAANSGDMDGNFTEDYEVLVSTTDTELSSFTKIVGVENENLAINPSIRGYNLSEFANKHIYIAFRLTTPDGYFMTIDNIGLYGDINNIPTDINNAEDDIINIEGNNIRCNVQGDVNIEIYDSYGKLIMKSNNNNVSIDALNNGIYMVRITVNGKTIVRKIMK